MLYTDVARQERRKRRPDMTQNTTGDWGVRWFEFNRQDQPVQKARYFRTREAMERFMDKVQDKDNFARFEATCGWDTEARC
jgi:hypothetical protein